MTFFMSGLRSCDSQVSRLNDIVSGGIHSMIWGKYDAKEGFMPGGGSLHSCMTPHGPDSETFRKGSDKTSPQTPVYFDEGLAFMFECNAMLKVPFSFYDERHFAS